MPSTSPRRALHREGLRFHKLDLHLHTPASRCFNDQSVTADAIIAEAKQKGLSAIAVTDHNSGAWVDAVKEAGQRAGIAVFPGVEITCTGGQGGIHLIALFDPSRGRTDIETLLGALDLKPEHFGDIATIVPHSVIDIAKKVHERGGLAVLAHANSSKGALEDMRGEQRIQLIKSPFISAAEGTDFADTGKQAARKRVVDLLDGTDQQFGRHLAVYQASDNPSGLRDGKHALVGIGTRCSYFKLDTINLEGLRQCFVDPATRIRQDFEFSQSTYPYISKVKVVGGFLDNAEADFHSGLNSILGAKGAGKSLLIEFLRFALDQEPTSGEIGKDHYAKLESRLKPYSSIELTFVDETGRSIPIQRTFNPAEDNPYAGPDRGDIAQLFPVLFLSQNEIIKIAEDPDQQIAFIDRFFDFRSYQNEIRAVEHVLKGLDHQLAESLRAYAEVVPVERSITTLKEELDRLDQSLKNPAFDEFSNVEAKDRALRAPATYLETMRQKLSDQRTEIEHSVAPEAPPQLAPDPAVKRSVELTKQAHAEVMFALDAVEKTVTSHQATLKAEYASWEPTFTTVKASYDAAVQAGGGNYQNIAQKRARVVKDLEAAQKTQADLKGKVDRIKSLNVMRNDQLTKLKSAYEAYTNERKAKCAKIQAESAGKLEIEISDASNREAFKARLMAIKRGSYLRDADIEKISANSDPGTFSKAIIRYGMNPSQKHIAELVTSVGIDLVRMTSLAEYLSREYPFEELLALEYDVLPQDRPEIRYAIGDGTFESIRNLSVGQKCTAMLMIALSEGTAPVVIDQPEDSLDIRSIWDDICSRIRHGKEHRQFIFTTHSSSVAVASDSDKFIILEAGATQSQVLFTGSMDHHPISEQVLNYLEGGKPTYRTKYRKYGADLSD